MKNHRATYDPEDIESLMSQKTFDELYDDERNFVLQHVSDENEYEEIRLTLLAIEISETPRAQTPKPETKTVLLEAFKNQRTSKWLVLLYQVNAFAKGLITTNHSLFRYGFIPATVLLLVIGGNHLFIQHEKSNSNMEFASRPNYSVEDAAATEEMTTEEAPLLEDGVTSEITPLIESTPEEITNNLELEAPGSGTYTWHAATDSITSNLVVNGTIITTDAGSALDITYSNGSTAMLSSDAINSNSNATRFGNEPPKLMIQSEVNELAYSDVSVIEEESEMDDYLEQEYVVKDKDMQSTLSYSSFGISNEVGDRAFYESKSLQSTSHPKTTSEHLKVIDYLYTAF